MKYIDETRAFVRMNVKGLTDEEKSHARIIAFRFVNHLESVQRMPMPLRLVYYRLTFHMYDLLRRNGQLGRRVGAFDPEVRKIIAQILYGNLADQNDYE